MASSWMDRGTSLGALLVTVLCIFIFRCQSVLARPFYYPAEGYQVQNYYNSDPRIQPETNGYNYYPPPNVIAARPEGGFAATGNANYYGVPGYEDQRYIPSRNGWNDPYARWQWKNYYNGYYPSRSGSGWSDRDDAVYYSRRRQDSMQVPETTTPETIVPLRPSVPRKKKLFVPNVWG